MISLADQPDLSEDFYLPQEGTINMYAEGPFVMKSETRPSGSLCVDLTQSGMIITVWDGRSGIELSDDEFTPSVSKDGEKIVFKSVNKGVSDILLVPASLDRIREEYSHLTLSDAEAVSVVRGLIRRIAGEAFGIYVGGKLTDVGLVVEDDTDNVLGLYVINKDGTFRRENGMWVDVDPEDEAANEELENNNWVEALDGAVAVFDEKENNDSLTLSDFDTYVL